MYSILINLGKYDAKYLKTFIHKLKSFNVLEYV